MSLRLIVGEVRSAYHHAAVRHVEVDRYRGGLEVRGKTLNSSVEKPYGLRQLGSNSVIHARNPRMRAAQQWQSAHMQ